MWLYVEALSNLACLLWSGELLKKTCHVEKKLTIQDFPRAAISGKGILHCTNCRSTQNKGLSNIFSAYAWNHINHITSLLCFYLYLEVLTCF